jgi:hypothetical protein
MLEHGISSIGSQGKAIKTINHKSNLLQRGKPLQ